MTAMRRVSAMTSALSASMASGTMPNTSSSVTHDQTVQTDLTDCPDGPDAVHGHLLAHGAVACVRVELPEVCLDEIKQH